MAGMAHHAHRMRELSEHGTNRRTWDGTQAQAVMTDACTFQWLLVQQAKGDCHV